MGRRRVGTVVAVVVALLTVLVGVLALGGTGGGSRSASTEEAARPRGPAAVPAPEAAVPGDAARDDARAVPGQAGASPALPDPVGRDVVRTQDLTIEVADPTAAARLVRTTAVAAGGFVAQEQADPGGASLVLRVPVAALDRVSDDIAATGRVVGRSGRAEDATEQVVDLDARVASQQASVTRVRALLAQATSIGDIVAVEAELASREADLDSLQRRLAALKDRVALSTVTVDLHRPATPVEPDGPPAGFGTGLGAGWEGLQAVGRAVAVVVGFLLPFLPVLAVVAAAVWFVVHRRRVRRASRNVPTPTPPATPTPQLQQTP